jgi:hypothetical protein
MLILVHIDISNADRPLFDEYEAKALALLSQYGARVEERLRSADDRSEVHLLHFPHADALAAFRADPTRAALQGLWDRSGATSTVTQVVRVI